MVTGRTVAVCIYDVERLSAPAAQAERFELADDISTGTLQPDGERLLAVFTVSAN